MNELEGAKEALQPAAEAALDPDVVAEEAAAAAAAAKKVAERVIVVGAGPAGLAAANVLKVREDTGRGQRGRQGGGVPAAPGACVLDLYNQC